MLEERMEAHKDTIEKIELSTKRSSTPKTIKRSVNRSKAKMAKKSRKK